MGLTDADSYREQLDDVLADLVHMAQVVSSAVRSATTALLEADIHLAEQVIGEDELIDAKQSEIEGRAFSLLARQAPVAGELRTIVAMLRMVTELSEWETSLPTSPKSQGSAIPSPLCRRRCVPTSSGWAMSRRRW